jgi:hypothetical protein
MVASDEGKLVAEAVFQLVGFVVVGWWAYLLKLGGFSLLRSLSFCKKSI